MEKAGKGTIIYFDNAATSFPKPKTVVRAMTIFMDNVGANPGRSGHRLSVEAGRIVNNYTSTISKRKFDGIK